MRFAFLIEKLVKLRHPVELFEVKRSADDLNHFTQIKGSFLVTPPGTIALDRLGMITTKSSEPRRSGSWTPRTWLMSDCIIDQGPCLHQAVGVVGCGSDSRHNHEAAAVACAGNTTTPRPLRPQWSLTRPVAANVFTAVAPD